MAESITGARCTAETHKAILVVIDDEDEYWIPKSQIDEDSEVYAAGHSGTLIVTTWFAEKEGLT